MGILGWIILGLVAGTIARVLHRGEEPSGVLVTMFVGVLGALLAGLIASAAGIGSISGFFSLGSWLLAIAGAFMLLVAYDAITSRSRGGAVPRRASAGRRVVRTRLPTRCSVRLRRVGGSRPGR